MPTLMMLGEIYEQEFDPSTGRYLRLVPTARNYFFNLDAFNVIHVRGRQRSGKTSRFLIPKWYAKFASPGAHFVIDLSPEPANLHHAARAARAAGKTFKYLCLEPGAATYHFVPFQVAETLEPENIVQFSQLLTTSFGLDRGTEQYFTLQGCTAVMDAFAELRKMGRPATLPEVAEFLDSPVARKKFPHAAEMVMPLQILAQYPQLNANPGREIRLIEAIQNEYVIYLYASNLSLPLTVRFIAGDFLASTIHYARELTNSGHKPTINIDIDEYQSMVSPQMAKLLFESLKYGIASYTLSHQSTSQLRTPTIDLSDSIFESSTLKIYFTSYGDDIEAIQSLSMPTRLVKRLGNTRGRIGLNQSMNESDEYEPFISAEAILEASERAGMAIVITSDGNGHREPVFVQMTHHGLDRLDHLALPMKPAARSIPPVVDPGPGRRISLSDPDRQTRHAAVRNVISRCVAETKWNHEIKG